MFPFGPDVVIDGTVSPVVIGIQDLVDVPRDRLREFALVRVQLPTLFHQGVDSSRALWRLREGSSAGIELAGVDVGGEVDGLAVGENLEECGGEGPDVRQGGTTRTVEAGVALDGDPVDPLREGRSF